MEKPDFEKISLEESEWMCECKPFNRDSHPDMYFCSRGQLLYALNKLWSSHVEPLQKENRDLNQQLTSRTESREEWKDIALKASNEVAKLKSENERLKEENTGLITMLMQANAELDNITKRGN